MEQPDTRVPPPTAVGAPGHTAHAPRSGSAATVLTMSHVGARRRATDHGHPTVTAPAPRVRSRAHFAVTRTDQ